MVFKRVLLTLIVLALFVGAVPAYAAYSMPYFIEVDLTNQIVTIYNTSDGSIARQMLCSSGEPGHDTIEGTFYLPAKDRSDERSEWYNFYTQHVYAKWATRIEGPYLFHSIPCHRPNLDTVVPEYLQQFGMPDSHGCVRLRVEDAYFIAKNCLRGTRVHIYQSGELDEDLRQLLYISSYTNEDGMTYQEFLGISDDSLGRGSSGQEVMDLQYRLSELGYYEGEPDGIYDNKMIATVKRLQRDMGISDTGITSDSMLEVIYSDEAPVSSGLVTLKEGKSGPVVKKLQEALNTLGLYSGDFDSILDLDVIEAVKKFQSACRYEVDGVLTPEIQQAIYYTVDKLEEKFGEGNIPPVELVTEEYWKCTLEASANIKIRQQASTESDELGKIFVGEELIVAGVDGDWANIVYKGINGYIYKKYLSEPVTEYSYNLLYADGSGNEYRIGKSLSDYLKGARSFADDFADIYASEQFSESSDEVVPFVTVNTGADNVALNMRAIPSGDGEVLETIPNGTSLRVLSSENDWTKVGYGESIGYLMNQYLEFWEGAASSNEETASGVSLADMDEAALASITGKAKVVIGEREGKEVKPYLYEEPDKKSDEVTLMAEGSEVEIVEFVEDAELGISWVKISYMGTSGYMMDICLEFEFEVA